MNRNTEYCQWTETRTCNRECDQECDDNNNCHDTNCVETCTYDYYKGWRNTRVNSLLFDQPAGHWNPQRDVSIILFIFYTEMI